MLFLQRDAHCEEDAGSGVYPFDAGEGEGWVQWLRAVPLSHSIAIGDISEHPVHSIAVFSAVRC